ncbi:MAG: hypothetical protein EBR86_04405 [Planctomycetia bacterium]|nr:hypothetical protein [Planctomycetia bacterium]
MATVTPRPASREGVESLAVGEWVAGDDEATHSDRYLAGRLAAATADYKGVALTTFLLGAGVAAMGWLAIGVIAEHWLVAGGLPRWLRWTWLASGLVALVAAAIRWLLPLVRYKVNLVYAARQIEREHPELHNDLVNTVLVRARPEGSPAVVVTSLKRRTARRLADLAGPVTMDRTLAVRLAYALLAAVAAACLYEVVAPKSLLVSAARMVAPWIGWAAPSRVRIDGPRLSWRVPDERNAADGAAGADPRRRVPIDGGKAVVVRGRQLEVTAAIRGLRSGEQPVCRVTPLTDAGGIDPRAASWQVTMHSGPEGEAAGRLFTALLPDADRGLDRSLEVSIVGGDAHTEPVRVAVIDAPALLVREVRYDFPAYTRRTPETVAWQGDLRAVEETLATLSVEGNQPLDAAWVDFGCDGQRDLKIKLAGAGARQGTVSFPLRLNADRTAAEHLTYRLVFQPAGAVGSREGVVDDGLEHRIEVIADVVPEIALEEPTDSPLQVPPGSPVLVRVRASDPDFGLARVGIETRIKGGTQVTPIVLLDEPHEGVFKGSSRLVPDKLGAGPGSVLEYRGFAIDTRPQQTNLAHSPWQELQIDAAAKPQPQPPDQPGIPDEPRRRDQDRQDRGQHQGADGGRERGRQEGAPRGQQDGQRDNDPQAGERGRQHDAGAERDADGAPAGRQPEGQAGKRQNQERGQRAEREPADAPRDQPGEAGGGGDRQQAGERGDGEGRGQQPEQGQNQNGGAGRQQEQPHDGAPGARSDESGGEQSDSGDASAGSDRDAGGERQRQPSGGRSRTGQSGRTAKEDSGGQDREAADDAAEPGEGNAGDADAAAANGRRPGGAGNEREGQDRVAPDGTNDGEAMERILEDRERKAGQGDARGTERQRAAQPDREPSGTEEQPRDGDAASRQAGEGRREETDRGGTQSQPRGAATKDGAQSRRPDESGAVRGQNSGDQGAGERDASEKGAGEKGAGEKGAGEKGAGEQGAGEKGAGEKGAGEKGAGEKGAGEKGAGEKGAGEKGAGEKGAGEKGAGEKGAGEKGASEKGAGEQGAGEKGAGEKGAGEKGAGERDASEKGAGEKGGAADQGQDSGNAEGGEAGPEDGPQDRGGTKGGGRKPGGAQGGQPGRPNGKAGEGAAETDVDGAPPSASDDPGAQQSGNTGKGGWARSDGAADPQQGPGAGEGPTAQTEWGDQDTAHARNAADLAIEHLRRSLDKGDKSVLDSLGWTKDEARAFLERWETLRRQADAGDPVKRRDFERTLQSLGLRGGDVRSNRDVPADVKGGQAEGRRSRPPSEYRERFKAYTQGTTSE